MASGFSFGAKTTASPPTFATPTFGFGSPATQPQPPSNLSFGAAAAPAATPSLFGTPAAAPVTTTSLFGSSTPSGGLFGSAPASAAPNLSFGAAPAAAAAPSLTFGAAPVSAAAGLSFGAAQASTAPSLSFTTPAVGQSFGAVNTSTAPTFGLGGSMSTPSLSIAPAAAAATSAAPSFGFGLGGGLTTTTTATSGLSFGLGATSTATTTTPNVGLGGIATSSQSKNTTITAQKEVAPKEQPLPNEILQTVEQFKEMVKLQKSHSSDISRCSIRDFRKVEQEMNQLNAQLREVEKQLQKNRQTAEKLKYDTAKNVQHVEIAQRTHDTPAGLQYENTAPLKFFFSLADQFENDMQNLKMQIEMVEKYVKSHKNPDLLTPQDLAMGMRRLHETFVALAGRLQSVHTQVESQKETYLNIRKHLLKDHSNPFEKLTRAPAFRVSNAGVHSPPKVASGPTPFNSYTLNASLNATQPPSAQPPPYPGPGTSGAASGFGAVGFGNPLGGPQPSNVSMFGANSFGQSSFSGSFQLQKPPTGNKRGKV